MKNKKLEYLLKSAMKWLTLPGCLLLIFTVSCTIPKPVTLKPLPINIPGNWSHGEKDKTENVQPWLDDFNDPELKKIVLKALEKNFDLKAAASRMYAANAIIRQVKANRLPQASARTGYKLFNNDAKFDGKPELNMNISWELDMWGKFSDLKKALASKFGSLGQIGSIKLFCITNSTDHSRYSFV